MEGDPPFRAGSDTLIIYPGFKLCIQLCYYWPDAALLTSDPQSLTCCRWRPVSPLPCCSSFLIFPPFSTSLSPDPNAQGHIGLISVSPMKNVPQHMISIKNITVSKGQLVILHRKAAGGSDIFPFD